MKSSKNLSTISVDKSAHKIPVEPLTFDNKGDLSDCTKNRHIPNLLILNNKKVIFYKLMETLTKTLSADGRLVSRGQFRSVPFFDRSTGFTGPAYSSPIMSGVFHPKC